MDDSDKYIPGTSRYKSRVFRPRMFHSGDLPSNKAKPASKRVKRRHRRRSQDGTILEFQSLEAFPAASGKFQGTKPDGIRKTGGNPVGAGVRREGTPLEKTLFPRLRLAAT